MNITIYQIDMDRDEDRVCFLSHENLTKFQGNDKINSAIYDKVFNGKVDCNSLEDVYCMFNLNHPEGYKGRSLSVSDVVAVCEDDEVQNGFYFCDDLGFKEVEFDPLITKDKTKMEVMNMNNDSIKEMESDNKISALLLQLGRYPQMIEIENNLESMQKVVGGDIEEYMPFEDDVAIICNEEGKINGLPFNRAIYDDNKAIIDIIAGDFLIVSAPPESENFLSLSKEMADKYHQKFKYPERFMKVNNDIVAIPYKPISKEKER